MPCRSMCRPPWAGNLVDIADVDHNAGRPGLSIYTPALPDDGRNPGIGLRGGLFGTWKRAVDFSERTAVSPTAHQRWFEPDIHRGEAD